MDEQPEVQQSDVLTLAQSGFWSETATWLASLLAALAAAAEGVEGSDDALETTVRQFTVGRSRVRGLPRRRPFIAAHRAALTVMHHLDAMTRDYLVGFSAETPITAKRLSDSAQAHLDAAASALPDLTAHERLADVEDADSVRELVAALTRRVAEASPEGDFLGAAQSAGSRAGEALGQTVSGSVGLRYLLLLPLVDNYLDPERFHSVARQALRVFTDNAQRLAGLESTAQFVVDLAQTKQNIFDALQQTWHVLRSVRARRQAVRAFTELAAGFVEDGGQVACIALLVCNGNKTRAYERLRQDNATDLLRLTRGDRTLAPLVEGLDPDLRIAVAHRRYVIGAEGELTLDARSTGARTIALDDLVDGLFTAMESVLALLLALDVALGAVGHIEVGEQNVADDLGLEPVDAAGLIMEVLLGAPATGREDGDAWTLTVDGTASGKLSPAVAAVATVLPPEIRQIRVLVNGANGESREYVGPADAYRSHASAEPGLPKDIAHIRIQRLWRLNGRPAMSREAFRLWISAMALEAIQRGYPDGLPALRALRTLAREDQDEQAARVLTDAMRDLRPDAANADRGYVALLAEWAVSGATWEGP